MTTGLRVCIRACLAITTAGVVSAQTVSFTEVGMIAGPADLVSVHAGDAYVASGKTLTIVDLGDPAHPKPLGSYTCPDLIWGLAFSGTRVFVADDLAGLVILDVSDRTAPKLLGTLKTPGQAKSVALYGTKALVADHVAGVDVVDLASPAAPRLLESMFLDGFAKGVVVRGSTAYALDQPAGLTIVDLTKPGPLSPRPTVTLAVPIPLRAQLAVSADDVTPRAAVIAGGGPLQIHDVSAVPPAAGGTVFRTPGVAQRVWLEGTRAYVADGPAGLQVVDLSTPAQPRIVAGHKTAAPARDVTVAGALVLVALADQGVVILRRTD